jgi:uncharacterized protein (DUF433 family)
MLQEMSHATPQQRYAKTLHSWRRGAVAGDSSEIVMNYRERITVEPGKRGGKPCIRGLRITVYDVLDQLSAGMTPEEIIEDFPELELEDIRACLGFAADRERQIAGPP